MDSDISLEGSAAVEGLRECAVSLAAAKKRWWQFGKKPEIRLPFQIFNGDSSEVLQSKRQGLLESGKVRWGAYIQMQTVMFKPLQTMSSLGYVLIGLDPQFDENPKSLVRIAEKASRFRSDPNAYPSKNLQAFQKQLNTVTENVHGPVPLEFSGGLQTLFTILHVDQRDLPGGFVVGRFFPVLTDDTTDIAVLVPQQHWPRSLTDQWVEKANPLIQHFRSTDFEFELSPAAADRIRQVMVQNDCPTDTMIHISLKGGAFKVGFENEQSENDLCIESEGLTVLIDKALANSTDRLSLIFNQQLGGFEFDSW